MPENANSNKIIARSGSIPSPETESAVRLVATCAFGLEAVVARELRALGYESTTTHTGRVVFDADREAIGKANLWLRAADRVLILAGEFPATDFGMLFDQTTALPWETWIPPEGNVPVIGRSLKSQLSSVPACQRIVKKAIVERLRKAHHVTELPESGAIFRVEIALHSDRAMLLLDTTGAGLNKRGYRKLVSEAQIKETLAAALVMLSFWKPERPLIDPFCGSGTIPIEAAMIGRKIAPGLQRDFVFESWPCMDPRAMDHLRAEARSQIVKQLPVRIHGYDLDDSVLSLARYHAEQAGVCEDIHFQQKAFADLTSKQQYGCIITNPPYGERIGANEDLDSLYGSLPNVLRKLPSWSHYILTAYPNLEDLVGQRADRRRKLYNARIECQYYQFHGPRPPRRQTTSLPSVDLPCEEEVSTPFASAAQMVPDRKGKPETQTIPQPAFGGVSEKSRQQSELFRSRLAKRVRHLRRYPTKQKITCFRLYERDIPEIPLVVDRYEDTLGVLYLHIAEFDRPHDRTVAEHADWLDLMAHTAGELLGVPRNRVFLKRRTRQRGTDQYEKVANEEKRIEVGEGGLKFLVNLSDYLDTGLFLDHRITRSNVREIAGDKKFLNLFAYTGSFTVYAAAGGASRTTTVDLSTTYLDWAADNMRLNGFVGDQHTFVRSDAREFLEQTQQEPTYDLAVVDVPTFSNSKDLNRDWDVQENHLELLRLLTGRMAPGGVVFFSSNSKRFKLGDVESLGLSSREISKHTVPEEFRNKRIHRCWRMTVAE